MTDTAATAPALSYRVSADGLEVSVWGRLPAEDPQAAVAALAADLRAHGVTAAPEPEERVRLLAGSAGPGGAVGPLVVARGRAPGASRDGRIEWARDFFAVGFVEDASGAVDFWQRRGNPSVGNGELIATLWESRRGADGADVYGTKLPAPAPAAVRLRAGANVRSEPADDDRVLFFATNDGRVRHGGGVVTVDNVFSVAGDVGLETGYIEHRGAVFVKGDVAAGSRIQSGGDCEVKGTVESAVLDVGGDLVVHGGIVGVGAEPIRVRGRVQAKFILDAEIEAGEGLRAESEIMHSQIRCRGPVDVPKGRIVASEVTALGPVTTGVAGGGGLSRTLVVAGVDHLWAARYAGRQEEAKGHEKSIARIRQTVTPLLEREKTLTPQQREAATELLARVSLLEAAAVEAREAAEQFAADSRARADAKVVVLQKAHADTVFQVGDARVTLDEEREGPFRVRAVRGKAMALPGERDAWGEGDAAGCQDGDEPPVGGAESR